MTPLPSPKNLDDIFNALSSTDMADNEECIIGNILTNDVLRKNSSPITDEDWSHMQKLANELEQYV